MLTGEGRGCREKGEAAKKPPGARLKKCQKIEVVTDLLLGSKITLDGDCSHEIRRRLFLGRKGMTNLDCVLKSRDITLLTKVLIDKAMVFPVVMYGYENWIIKKAEH